MKEKPQNQDDRLAKAEAVRKEWRYDAQLHPCIWTLGVTAGIEIMWSILTGNDPRYVIVETPVNQTCRRRSKGWFSTAI